MRRIPVQIAISPNGGIVYALADDGTLWWSEVYPSKWNQIAPLPPAGGSSSGPDPNFTAPPFVTREP